MAEEMGLFEAMYTQRALRYIKPDPIPDAVLRKVLDAGIRAPNGGNQQRWRFIVIKDPATKRWIQERYRATDRPAHAPAQNPAEVRTMGRNDAASEHLAAHLHEVTVLAACSTMVRPATLTAAPAFILPCRTCSWQLAA